MRARCRDPHHRGDDGRLHLTTRDDAVLERAGDTATCPNRKQPCPRSCVARTSLSAINPRMNIRTLLQTFALLCILFACSAPSGDDDSNPSSGELRASTSNTETQYRGSFVLNDESYVVELAIRLPTTAIGFQEAWARSDRPYTFSRCMVYNEASRATARIRVSTATGRVLSEVVRPTSINGRTMISESDCPGGILAPAYRRAVRNLPDTAQIDGFTLELAGTRVDLPSGYFKPGAVSLPASVSFDPLVAPRWSVDHSSVSTTKSSMRVEKGRLTYVTGDTIDLRLGVGSPKADGGYERLLVVHLSAIR